MINTDSLNIKTDNIPLLDELIFNLKKIVDSCVLKDQQKADNNETLESQRNSDLYISCIEERVNYKSFTYNQQDLEDVGIPHYIIDECLRDKSKIPELFRKPLVDKKTKLIIDNYIEYNSYYRMLNGKPAIGENGIKISEDMIPQDIYGIDISKYLHEMKDNEIDILYTFGVIDEVIKKYPQKKYLKYMGSKRISIYNARKAVDSQLLYMTSDIPDEVSKRFKEKIEINRIYTKKVIYSEAFKIGSDYYDSFIRSFIVIQTMIDMITELPDMIIKREIFDIRMVQLVLQNSGIDFYQEIPYRYQIAMVRNINTLLKYKSTSKNIVDICSLFGFDNIKVFKYYLLKHRNVNKYGEYEFNYKEEFDYETEKYHITEDNDKDFTLKFVKVPIDEQADDYIQNNSYYSDYDEFTELDKYWDGDLDHNYIRTQILKREFNYIQSKYLSIDTIYSLTELSFELMYFYNMIFDDVKLEEILTLRVPEINGLGVFKFTDIICYIYALMYEYNGVSDNIMDTPTKVLSVKGFNFKANMAKLAEYVHSQGYTLEELGVSDFQIPTSSILTYNQLMDIFTRNKNIHDHIIHQLYTANNKEIYDIYKTIYDALMITELNLDFFRLNDGSLARTYTEFLNERDPILYNSIIQIRNMDSQDVKKEKITKNIDAVVYAIEELIDLDQYKYIFNHIPAVGAESVKYYIYKVVNFFKSYKVDFFSINTVYTFDDRLENKIKMIDSAFIQYFYHKQSNIDLIEKINNISKLNYKEKAELEEKIFIEYTFFLDMYFSEDKLIKDSVSNSTVFDKRDSLSINDGITIRPYIDNTDYNTETL